MKRDNAYRLMVYGDSNSWGFIPLTGEFDQRRRYPFAVRWPGVMLEKLRAEEGLDDVVLIEEALGGRTTVFDDQVEGAHKNGLTYLKPCLESQAPLDLVIIMLGTNDCKTRFSVSAFDIGRGAAVLVQTVLQSAAGPGGTVPGIVLVSPPPLGKITFWEGMFSGGLERSAGLAHEYRMRADAAGVRFFDAGSVIETDGSDGVHLSEGMHAKLGGALAGYCSAFIRDTIGSKEN